MVPLGDDDPVHPVTLLQSPALLPAAEPDPAQEPEAAAIRGGFPAHRLPQVLSPLGAQSWLGQRTCLVQLWSAGLGGHVHHIDSGGDKTG